MTLGSTFPAPINRLWYPVNLIIRLIIHCFPCLSLSVSPSLSWLLRRETLPVPSLWLCRHTVCQFEVPPGAPPPWASKWLYHLCPILWPHPFFWPQRGSWEDSRRWRLCPTRCPPECFQGNASQPRLQGRSIAATSVGVGWHDVRAWQRSWARRPSFWLCLLSWEHEDCWWRILPCLNSDR